MAVIKIIDMVRERWLLLVAAIMIGAAAGFGASMSMTPYFTAATQLFVTTTGGTTSTESYQGDQFSQQRASSYAQILSSETLGQRVVNSLGLDLSASDIASKVSARRVPQTVIVDVSVRDTSARRAADIANTLSDEFISYVASLETPTGQEQPRATVSMISGAEPATAPSSPKTTTNVCYGALAGMILGLILIAILRFRKPVVSMATLSSVTRRPVLLGPISKTSRNRLLSGRESPEAEQLRKIRAFLQSGQPAPRVLMVTTPSEAEGALAFAVDLALIYAETESPTVVVETYFSQRSLATELSVESAPGLIDILTGRCSVAQAVKSTVHPYLTAVVLGDEHGTAPLLSSMSMTGAVRDLLQSHQTVIVVAAPVTTSSAPSVLSSVADGVVLVADAVKSRLPAIAAAVDELDACKAHLVSTVLVEFEER